jgi:hypothetical protein
LLCGPQPTADLLLRQLARGCIRPCFNSTPVGEELLSALAFRELIAGGWIQRFSVRIDGGLNVRSQIGVRHGRIAEFLFVHFRNGNTLAQLASRALRCSSVCHAYHLYLLPVPVRFCLRTLFGRRVLGQTCSNSIWPRRCAETSFMASMRSCPKLGFFDATCMPYYAARGNCAR